MTEVIAVISFVSAVAALVEVGSTVVNRLNDFHAKTQEVPEAFKHIKAQLPITIVSLRRTKLDAQAGNVDSATQKALMPAIEGCHSQIRRLDDILDRVLPAKEDSSWARKIKALRSISKDKEVQIPLNQIDRYLLRIMLYNTSGTSSVTPQFLSVQQVIMVPTNRDPNFIDRPEAFKELQDNMTTFGRAALAGIGGVGKTQIAIEQCYRFLELHPEAQIFWAHAGTLPKFVQACKVIAAKLRLPNSDDSKADILQLVQHWLSSDQNGPWLFVLDNLDDVQLLNQPLPSSNIQNALIQYFPRVSNCALIVTTRDKRVGERLAVRGKTIVVSTMATPESMRLLRSYLPSSISVAADDLQRLVEYLDELPLAITQAAAYITEQATTVKEYFSMLQDGDEDMQQLLSESLSDNRRTDQESNSVIKTWKLSFDQITKQNPRAAQMLSLMAMFDRQGIPSNLLKRQEEPKRVFIQALGTLQSFSLIAKVANTETYEMHRLVQLSTQAWLEVQNTTTNWRNKALHVLAEHFPNGSYFEYWQDCETLLPHARAILQYQCFSDDACLDCAKLLENLACFDYTQGRYDTALVESREASEKFARLLGSESPITFSSTTTYARCLAARGERQKALQLLRKSSAAQEQMFGPNHPETLKSTSSLAWNLYAQNKYHEAEVLQRRILALKESSLGLTDSTTLWSMGNLAVTLVSLEKYQEAEELQRKTLLAQERVLVPNHPDTIKTRHNLAWSFSRRKKWDEATEQYRLVLSSREKVLGAEKPETLKSRHGVAWCLYNQAKYDEAIQHYRIVLTAKENDSDPKGDSIGITRCRSDYAWCLSRSNKWDEAVKQFQRIFASKVWMEAFDSLDIMRSRHNLAWCLSNLKRYDEAVEQYRVILAWNLNASLVEDSGMRMDAAKVEKGLSYCLEQLALSRKEDMIAADGVNHT